MVTHIEIQMRFSKWWISHCIHKNLENVINNACRDVKCDVSVNDTILFRSKTYTKLGKHH